MSDKKIRPEANWLDAEAIRRVAEALGSANAGTAVDGCKMGDVRHVIELLARIIVLEDTAPGFTASMLDTFLQHFLREQSRMMVAAEAQSVASASGFGDEWARAMTAGRTKGQGVRAAQGVR